MPGISDNNVALAVVNGDDDEKKVNLIRMVTMMRKKKILLEWCAGPQDSPHCAYIAQARTHRGYGVCIGYIHCSQKLTQGHYQGSNGIWGGKKWRQRGEMGGKFYRQGL